MADKKVKVDPKKVKKEDLKNKSLWIKGWNSKMTNDS